MPNASCRLTDGSTTTSARAIPREPFSVGDVAKEAHAVRDAKLGRQRLQRHAQRTVADDDRRGGHAHHGPKQHVHTLVGHQPSDEEHGGRGARGAPASARGGAP